MYYSAPVLFALFLDFGMDTFVKIHELNYPLNVPFLKKERSLKWKWRVLGIILKNECGDGKGNKGILIG